MAFHWQGGITLERVADGLVEMFIPTEPNDGTGIKYHIPAAEWASIIAAVSAEGETALQYQNALAIHNFKGLVISAFNT